MDVTPQSPENPDDLAMTETLEADLAAIEHELRTLDADVPASASAPGE